MDLIGQMTKKAKEQLASTKGSHDWDHTLRVYNLCLHIGKKEDADMEILSIAALLHDIGRAEEDRSNGKVCHAKRGAEIAKNILAESGVDNNKIEKIIHCIRTHRFKGKNIPKSKEAKVLFDADKLDSIGAVGIGRAFLFSGEVGGRLHDKDVDISKDEEYTKEDTAYREYLVKLVKVNGRMLTSEGKRIASERHKFMVEFFDRLNKEVEGIL